MEKKTPYPSRTAVAPLPSCEKCRRLGTLQIDRTSSPQHVKCTRCGEKYVLAPRAGWTLVDPNGAIASFDSPEALRESLAENAETTSVKKAAKTNASGSPLPTNDDTETALDEDDLSNAETHDVPSSAPSQLAPTTGRPTVRILQAPPLPPPPPPRRASSTPPADSATIALGRLPTPSPLPPRVDASPTGAPPAGAPPNATLRGIGKAPSSERASQAPVASESTRTLGALLRGVDAFAQSGGSMPVAPSVMAATGSISEPQITSKSAAARENDAGRVDEPSSEKAPLSDETPSSEDAIPLHRLSTKPATRESESALQPVATSMTTRVADDVTGEPIERLPKAVWTEDDDEGLAIGPPVRRGGWLVASALIAAAAGFVFYLQRSSQPTEPRTAVTTTNAPVSETDSPRTAVPPPTALVAFSTATTSATPTSLVPSPEATTPEAITTTTNADTAPTLPQTAASPPMTEPISEDILPTSELLHRAHASLREGDKRRAQQRFRLALAKDPSNVEAMTGLGDIARAENDLAAARDHYQHAIDRSPLFIPARLALADVEWDLGDRSAARKNYAATVDKLGDRAPARAKERKGDAGPKP